MTKAETRIAVRRDGVCRRAGVCPREGVARRGCSRYGRISEAVRIRAGNCVPPNLQQLPLSIMQPMVCASGNPGRSHAGSFCLSLLLVLMAPRLADAQLPLARLYAIHPSGAQRSTSVDLTLAAGA